MGFLETLQYRFKTGNLAMKLIFINVGLYLVISILEGLFKIPVITWLGLETNLTRLFIKPWSVFTYMFVHASFFHLLFNMFMLYVIGEFFYRYFDDKAFAKFYFLGGLCGGLLFLLVAQILHQHSILMGASAAIYAVLFAMVAYQPELRVRLFLVSEPIKLLYVAIGFVALGFIINTDNLGGNISHVGGAIFGYLYMKQFERGQGIFANLKNPFKDLFKKKSHLKPRVSKSKSKPPTDDFEYADWKKQKEDMTNRILEKISRSGYNSLTKEEKEFLFKQGKGKT